MATATQRAEDVDKSAGIGEVSLGQKMLSAVSGSVLTSLLGVYNETHPNSCSLRLLHLLFKEMSQTTVPRSNGQKC